MDTKSIINAVAIVANLNNLADMTTNGFYPFSQCKPETQDEWSQGIVYIDEPKEDDGSGFESHDIVGAYINDGHPAIALRWSDELSNLCGAPCEVTLSGLEDNEPYIFAEVEGCHTIVIEKGSWNLL